MISKIWDFNFFEDKIALIDDNDQILTYSELEEAGHGLAGLVGRRCLVFIACSNSIGSVVGYTAFINNGIVPLLINAGMEYSLLKNLVELYHPEYLWVPDEKSDAFSDMKVVFHEYGYVLLQTGFDADYPIFDELALLLTTSGSTGSPKFVRQSYANIRANTKSIIEYLELDDTERAITTLPMNYTYGLSIINTHLYVGASVLLTGHGLMEKEFWRFFEEEKATSFGGVPYTYEMLDKLRFYRKELPSLRTITQAGGKLSEELHEKIASYAKESGRRFFVMYGQCEATARMGYLPSEKAYEKKGSMGIAIPGGKFSLADEKCDEITTPFSTGELIYEGENVTLGYAENMSDLGKGDERHGKLKTGDLAYFDNDGYYYIVGRKKRFIKIFGNRVNLDETGAIIRKKFGIEAVCAGIDDHMYIFITKKDIGIEVRKYVSDITRLNKDAFKTVVLEEIPMTESGKVKYSALEKYYDI